MRRKAQVTESNSYEECEEMSLTNESDGTKTKPPNHPKHEQKTNNHRNKQIRLMSALILKSKKVQIRRPTQK